jgi:uncharacterized protein
MKFTLLALLGIYKRIISPIFVALFGRACVYEVSCSDYAAGAIKKHGPVKGGALSVKRFLSCNNLLKSTALERI